jgi:hypothetical protein
MLNSAHGQFRLLLLHRWYPYNCLRLTEFSAVQKEKRGGTTQQLAAPGGSYGVFVQEFAEIWTWWIRFLDNGTAQRRSCTSRTSSWLPSPVVHGLAFVIRCTRGPHGSLRKNLRPSRWPTGRRSEMRSNWPVPASSCCRSTPNTRRAGKLIGSREPSSADRSNFLVPHLRALAVRCGDRGLSTTRLGDTPGSRRRRRCAKNVPTGVSGCALSADYEKPQIPKLAGWSPAS